MPLRDHAPVGAPCWIDLMTPDPDRSRAFYGDLFGWTFEEGGPEVGGYATFSKDGVIAAGCMQDASRDSVWTVYLATDDIDKTVALAAEHGGQVLLPPMAVTDIGHMAMVSDPAGGATGVWQPLTHKGFGAIAQPGFPDWFELCTRAYEPTVAFYEQVFGWDTHAMGDTADFRYTTFGEGDGALAGIMDTSSFPGDQPSHWQIYLGTPSVDASLATTIELGGTMVEPAADTPFGRMATVTDPTGATFKLHGA